MTFAYLDIVRAAAKKGINSLSAIPAPNNTTTSTASNNTWFDSTLAGPQRRSIFATSNTGFQSAANINGHMALLSALGTNYIPTINSEVTSFSVGDTFIGTSPHYSTHDDITKYCISIVPASLMEDSPFVAVAQTLDTLPPFAGGIQGGLERFNLPNYDATDPSTHPVLVYIPVICPLDYVHKLTNNASIAAMDIGTEDFTKGGTLETWVFAMKWLVDNNNGHSLHDASQFFNHADLNLNVANGPDATALSATCNFNELSTQLPSTATSGYTEVEARIHEAILMTCMKAGVTTSDPDPPTPPRTPTNGFTTQTEQHQNQKNAEKIMKLRLSLVGLDDNGNVVIPELSDRVTGAYKERNMAAATELLRGQFRDWNLTAAPKLLKEYGTAYDFSHDEMYPFFVKAVLDGMFYTDNLRLRPKDVFEEITIFNFLKPKTSTVEYEEVVKEGQKALNMVAMTPDNKNVQITSKGLYAGGHCKTLQHALSAIAGMHGWFLFLLEDGTTMVPRVCNLLRELHDKLSHMGHRRTVESLTEGPNGNPYFITNFLLDAQQALSQHFMFCHNPYVRSIMKSNGDMQPLFDEYTNNVDTVLQNMDVMFTTGKFDGYKECPVLYAILFGKPDANKNVKGGTNGQSPGKGNRNNGEQSPAKKQKKSKNNSSPAPGTGNRGSPNGAPTGPPAKGIIKNVDGSTKVPIIPTSILAMNKAQGNAMRKVCRQFATEGLTCRNVVCPYAHVTYRTFQSNITNVDHQKEFCDFVNNNPDITWAGEELKPIGS